MAVSDRHVPLLTVSYDRVSLLEKQLSDVVYHHLKPGKGCRVPFKVEIQTEVDCFMKVMWSWFNLQAQQHARKRDLVTVALRQIEGVVVSPPVLTEGSLVIDPDTVTPVEVFEAAPSASSEAVHKATAHPGPEGLVNQSLKNLENLSNNLSGECIKSTISTLREMVWAEIPSSDTVVKPSGCHIKDTIKAVHKRRWAAQGWWV